MKPTGTGSILLWRGGSLWIGRSGEPADFHSHHAIQMAMAWPRLESLPRSHRRRDQSVRSNPA